MLVWGSATMRPSVIPFDSYLRNALINCCSLSTDFSQLLLKFAGVIFYCRKWQSQVGMVSWDADEQFIFRELYSNNISGSIPKELGNLSKLVSLDLYQNNFSGIIPDTLGKLTSLRFLYVPLYLNLNASNWQQSFVLFPSLDTWSLIIVDYCFRVLGRGATLLIFSYRDK